MAYCIHCGNKLSDKAKFCSNCGETIKVTMEEESPKQTMVTQEKLPVKRKAISLIKKPKKGFLYYLKEPYFGILNPLADYWDRKHNELREEEEL